MNERAKEVASNAISVLIFNRGDYRFEQSLVDYLASLPEFAERRWIANGDAVPDGQQPIYWTTRQPFKKPPDFMQVTACVGRPCADSYLWQPRHVPAPPQEDSPLVKDLKALDKIQINVSTRLGGAGVQVEWNRILSELRAVKINDVIGLVQRHEREAKTK